LGAGGVLNAGMPPVVSKRFCCAIRLHICKILFIGVLLWLF
jgi:hypothetical protein